MLRACPVVLCLVLAHGQASPASEQTGGAISGWTLSSGGTPIGNVAVTLACPPRPVRTAISDANGRFDFAALPDGACRMIARKAGYIEATFNGSPAPGGYGIAVRAGTTLDGIELRMEPGVTIAGRVVDAAGNPVTAAFVHVVKRESINGVVSLRAQAPYLAVREGGRFEMPPLAAGEYYVGVRPPPGSNGHAFTFYPRTTQLSAATPIALSVGERKELTLSLLDAPTFPISGVVVDASGEPLVGAQVGVDAESPLSWIRGTTRTTAGGRFSIDGLEDGDYVVRASVQRADKRREGGEVHVTVAGGEVAHLTLRTAVR
jgi:hypothetical protein